MYFEPVDLYTQNALRDTLLYEARTAPYNRERLEGAPQWTLIKRFEALALRASTEGYLLKYVLQVSPNDCEVDKATGLVIAREIMWVEKGIPVDDYGLPVKDAEPKTGLLGCFFNHGTKDSPSWSSRT